MPAKEAHSPGYPYPLGFTVNQSLALRMANSSPENVWRYGLGKLCKDMKLAPAKGEVNGTLVLRGLHTAKYLKNPCTKKSSGGPARETYKLSGKGTGVLTKVIAASGWMLDKIPDDLDCAPAEDFKDLGNMKLGALAILISGMEEEGTYASKLFTRFFAGSGTEITGRPSPRVMHSLNTAKLFSDPTTAEGNHAPNRNMYQTTKLGEAVLALAIPALEMIAGSENLKAKKSPEPQN